MRYLFLALLLVVSLSLVSCGGDDEIVVDNGVYSIKIDSLSNEFFKQGDTLHIYGANLGDSHEGKTIIFHGSEISEDGFSEIQVDAILSWSDTEISVLVPDDIVRGNIYINSKLSNSRSFEVSRPWYIRWIEYSVQISLFITLIFIYLKINKIWKRKHERQVADSQSLAGLFIYILNCFLWVLYYWLVSNDVTSMLDTSIYILEGAVYFLIGTGIFVSGQTKERIWILIKQALNLERSEADYLLKKFFKPQNAEAIINILHQLAMIDDDLDEKEQYLIQMFAKEWNIDYSIEKLNKERHTDKDNNYIRLRTSLQDYLKTEPPREQVAQLKDMMNALINADDIVSKEEEIISTELTGLIEQYLDADHREKTFHVIIVPQFEDQKQVIKSLLPETTKVKTSGGIAYSMGEFYSQKYADMICNQYRQLELFTIIQEPVIENNED
jgi:hypothetical protein